MASVQTLTKKANISLASDQLLALRELHDQARDLVPRRKRRYPNSTKTRQGPAQASPEFIILYGPVVEALGGRLVHCLEKGKFTLTKVPRKIRMTYLVKLIFHLKDFAMNATKGNISLQKSQFRKKNSSNENWNQVKINKTIAN